MFVCVSRKGAVLIEGRSHFRCSGCLFPSGGNTDLPLGSTINAFLLFPNELHTEEVGMRVCELERKIESLS